MADIKYVAKHSFPDHGIKPGEEVSPQILGLSLTQFNYLIDHNGVELAEDQEDDRPHHVYDVHHL